MCILLLLFSCVRQKDYICTFHVYGQVVDANNNTGIDKVNILFVDRGFDEERSTNPKNGTYEIGFTKDGGYFDVVHNYWWGYGERILKPGPKKKFEIWFKKPGYKDKYVTYEYNKLPNTRNTVEVNIGKIRLETLK